MKYRLLPGDVSSEERIARMLRVDHAGEYGAVRIYSGQRDVLRTNEKVDELLHEMQQQEETHLINFVHLMQQRNVRPSALMPLWHIFGYAMGALTARLGVSSAMACTVAVEEVIDEHYLQQEKELSIIQDEKKLRHLIAKHRREENEHKETALQSGAEDAKFYKIIRHLVRNATKLAIKASKRI